MMYSSNRDKVRVMYIIGITGASGPVIGVRLIEELLARDLPVASIISKAAAPVLRHEVPGAEKFTDMKNLLLSRRPGIRAEQLTEFDDGDLWAPPSSGTAPNRAVIIAPCSMKTLSAVAAGYADTLIHRAADVALKEGRKCVLVPRETPLSLIHLENMAKAKRAGADIVPPVPGFYTRPETVDDIIDYVVGKILNLLGIEHDLFRPWEPPHAPEGR